MASVKVYPNWRGIKGIRYVYNGSWSDWNLIYKSYVFTGEDIEDALWENFLEDTGHKDNEAGNEEVEKEFNMYLEENAKPYLDDCIWGKCYLNKFKY